MRLGTELDKVFEERIWWSQKERDQRSIIINLRAPICWHWLCTNTYLTNIHVVWSTWHELAESEWSRWHGMWFGNFLPLFPFSCAHFYVTVTSLYVFIFVVIIPFVEFVVVLVVLLHFFVCCVLFFFIGVLLVWFLCWCCLCEYLCLCFLSVSVCWVVMIGFLS